MTLPAPALPPPPLALASRGHVNTYVCNFKESITKVVSLTVLIFNFL